MEDFYCRDYIAPRNLVDSLQQHKTTLQDFTGIVTVSETSKQDLAWFFPQYKDKIAVIYPGTISSRDNNEIPVFPLELENAQYFLIVGYEKKKNIERVTSAFDAFKSQKTGSQSKLVIVGKSGYGAAEIDGHISSLKYQQDIIRYGYVSEAQKQQLLQQCHALVALPIYEGFGISALEGLKAGKIVLVSDNGSLKEIVGNAGYTADPFSVESMKRQFLRIDALDRNPKHKYIAKRLEVFNQATQSYRLLKYLTGFA